MKGGGFYHCSVKSVGRGNGASIVQKSAYRAGVRIEDERTGETADYRARGGVDQTFMVARADAAERAQDFGRLWNEAERAEPRANGRLATEIVVAFPCEFDVAGRRKVVDDFTRPIVDRHGIVAQVSIHAPDKNGDQRNWHAHILFSHREFGPDGFGEVSNPHSASRKVKGVEKEVMYYGIAATPADIKALRKQWEQTVNREYERQGLDIQVDHRSHKDRGLIEEPSKHLGPTASEMERKEPGSSDRGDVNRDIEARNAARKNVPALEAEVKALAGEIIDIKAERAMQEARDAAKGRYDMTGPPPPPATREPSPGRYDELKAPTPSPEAVREPEANAERVTEPPAPVWDRDADNAAWEDKLTEAAIAADLSAEAPAKADATAGRGEDSEPTADLWDELRAWNEDAQPARADEIEATREPHDADATPDHAAEMFEALEDTLGSKAVGGAASKLAAAVEKVLGGIFSFFGGGDTKLSPEQMKQQAKANAERAEARAVEAAEQELQATLDDIVRQRDIRRLQEEIERKTGHRPRDDDDYDRGRERER